MGKVFIIAEAGVNHNGSIITAKRMIDVAKDAGVDAIKFQTFKAERLVSKNAQKAEYQKQNTNDFVESQLQMLKKLELSNAEFKELREYCEQKEIMFLSTPFDLKSIDFLSTLDMDLYKIPSGEITNFPYLVKIAKTKKDIILSTGMCNLSEINDAVNVLKDNGSSKISLLHCTTEYPTPFMEVNLRAMQTLQDKFKVDVGYSDHTQGIEVAIAAVAMGARIIEKHFTLDKSMEGPDHRASLNPCELKKLVESIRNIELSMGNGEKKPTNSEAKQIIVTRKSIVAQKKIKKGELLTENNITTKRPGNGISPMKWNEVVGSIAIRNFEEDELIEL